MTLLARLRHLKNHEARNQLGFSLLEVGLAVLITAMITTAIWMVFKRTFTLREQALDMAARYRSVRTAMDMMARDLEMAFISLRQGPTKSTQTIFKQEDGSPCDKLTFTSLGHLRLVKDSAESDQNELSYYCDDDPDNPGTLALFRREARRIDEDPERGGVHYVLLSDISSLDFKFYDQKTDEWVDEWDSTQLEHAMKLPTLVRIEVKIPSSDNSKDEVFVTKTRIELNEVLR
ncbi:MAG: hypothetical protein GXP49_18175 [Deltaproteobacteria bacterium]|nr:hypothetical protein [Deltaproteobacteria bacterium]